MYEQAVEALVLKCAGTLFPGFAAEECKPYFDTPHGGVQPDIVLIRHDLEEWALVEVELEEHSANGHVKPQVGRLVHAVPDRRASRKILDAFGTKFDERRAFEVLSRPPRVFLVTHGQTPVNDYDLRALGVEAFDVRIFWAGASNYQMVVRHRMARQRRIPDPLIRVRSPMANGSWTLTTPEVKEFVGRKTVAVSAVGETHNWSLLRTDGGYIFKMPTELSSTLSFDRAQLSVTEGSPNVTLTPTTY